MSQEYEEILELLETELIHDVLLAEVKQRKEQYKELISQDFLGRLEPNKWYSTVEAAEMFGISDSKLRYYIKPLYNYVLPEDTPSSNAAYRLNYLSIIKLKMILLLKDEFKVAGLQTLIGIRGRVINPSKEKGLEKKLQDDTDHMEERIEQLETMLSSFLNSGLFIATTKEDGEQTLDINSEFLSKKYSNNLIGNEEIESIQEEVSQLKQQIEEERKEKEKLREEFYEKIELERKEKEKLREEFNEKIEKEKIEKEKIREDMKQLEKIDDIALNFKENQKIRKLELEASQEWDKQNKGLKKLFATEYNKRKFISEYVESELNKDK